MTVIIVEGCDFTGKSTVVDKLSKTFQIPILKFPRPQHLTDALKWVDQVMTMSRNGHVICDRSPLISEPIYGPICRPEQDPIVKSETSIALLHEIQDVITVFCCPQWGFVSTCNNEQMTGVKENLSALYRAYINWMQTLRQRGATEVIQYDFQGVDAEKNLLMELCSILDAPIVSDVEVEQVREFHDKFGVPMPSLVQQMPQDIFEFRLKFLKEELKEFEDAYNEGDLVTQVDSLIDLDYVLKGTALLMGVTSTQWGRMFNVVHECNMKKMRAPSEKQSKRGHSLDVIKPQGWLPHEPQLKKILGV